MNTNQDPRAKAAIDFIGYVERYLNKEVGSNLIEEGRKILGLKKEGEKKSWPAQYDELLGELNIRGYTIKEIEKGSGLPDTSEYWNNTGSTYKYKLIKLN